MLDLNIQYFNTSVIHSSKETSEHITCTIIFTPKELIKDIIWDFSNTFIPFSNGKKYYIYQDLVFNIIDFFDNSIYSYISTSINNEDKQKPSMIISNIKESDYKDILKICNEIITNYINKKFSLWN